MAEENMAKEPTLDEPLPAPVPTKDGKKAGRAVIP